MTVTFPAQVKEVKSRVLATGDKGGRMVVEFNIYDDELIGQLARFVTADEESQITIESIK